jgi:hypothetical protein
MASQGKNMASFGIVKSSVFFDWLILQPIDKQLIAD